MHSSETKNTLLGRPKQQHSSSWPRHGFSLASLAVTTGPHAHNHSATPWLCSSFSTVRLLKAASVAGATGHPAASALQRDSNYEATTGITHLSRGPLCTGLGSGPADYASIGLRESSQPSTATHLDGDSGQFFFIALATISTWHHKAAARVRTRGLTATKPHYLSPSDPGAQSRA
jgi:hypothetical protein